MSNKTIVLCLDVDDTLINRDDKGIISFNGSPELWSDFLTKLRLECKRAGCKLIVQIISAKVNGNVDRTIQNVVQQLHPFLPARTQSGNLKYESSALQYYAMFHVDGRDIKKIIRCDRIYDYINNYQPIPEQPIVMPAVHVCQRNVQGHTSKAKVMQQISEHFTVPAANMFLLDNDDSNRRDVETGAHGLTPHYTFVSAYELWRLRKSAASEERGKACQFILGALYSIIKCRIAVILEEEAVKHCVQKLVDDVVAANLVCEKSSLSAVRERSSGSCAFFQPAKYAIPIKRMVLHGSLPFICDEQQAIEVNRRLSLIHFDDYVVFFQKKAQRKATYAARKSTLAAQKYSPMSISHRAPRFAALP